MANSIEEKLNDLCFYLKMHNIGAPRPPLPHAYGCVGKLDLTRFWLADNGFEPGDVLWFHGQGVYCDCEVMRVLCLGFR